MNDELILKISIIVSLVSLTALFFSSGISSSESTSLEKITGTVISMNNQTAISKIELETQTILPIIAFDNVGLSKGDKISVVARENCKEKEKIAEIIEIVR